jgi:hypothetical protein
MKLHCTVTSVVKGADWGGQGTRIDLRTKNHKKPTADLHLYADVGSPLSGIEVGAVVEIETRRPKPVKK